MHVGHDVSCVLYTLCQHVGLVILVHALPEDPSGGQFPVGPETGITNARPCRMPTFPTFSCVVASPHFWDRHSLHLHPFVAVPSLLPWKKSIEIPLVSVIPSASAVTFS